MNISGGQFDSEWARPQQIANPFQTTRGWNADRGIQTGKAHPEYEGVDDPLPWKSGAATALERATAWRSPGGAVHTTTAPHSAASIGSTIMGGASGPATEFPKLQSRWRSASFNAGES